MQERKLTVRLSAKLLKSAKLKSVQDDLPLSEVVRDLLAGWTRGEIRLEPLSGETPDELFSRFLQRITPQLNELGSELAKHGKSITTDFSAKDGRLTLQQGDLEKPKAKHG